MASHLKHFLSASILAMAGVAHAQLADPTKPPSVMSADDPAGTAVPVASGLQVVIMRINCKPVTLIDGNVVKLGDPVGEAKLVRIKNNEDAVVLRGPQGNETLRLTPAAEKKFRTGKETQKTECETAQSEKKGASR